jgi:hypothetical protein
MLYGVLPVKSIAFAMLSLLGAAHVFCPKESNSRLETSESFEVFNIKFLGR